MADEGTTKYLDYDGLKTLVQSILKEIPIADESTIVNKDGVLSAKNSPVRVNNDTLYFN